MALPKEPRQKMINLMYLVLTALLALNVSAEILNAFKTVDNSLDKTNSIINVSTSSIMESFADKAADPKTAAKAAIWYPKAQEAQRLTTSMYAYIENLRNEILKAADFNPAGKKGDSTYKEDNQDIPTKIMVKDGKGKELQQKLAQYREAMLKLDPKVREEFGNAFQVDVSMPKVQNASNKTWEDAYFNMVPTVAALTILRKFQNDVKTSENRVVGFIHGQVDKVTLRFDAFEAIVGQNSKYLMPGQELEITAGLGAFSRTKLPTISIGGSSVPLNEKGMALYKTAAGSIGQHTIPVNVSFTDQDGNPQTKTFNVEYTVGQSNASIALDKMNVLYIGVDNPVTIAASGGGDDKVQVSITGGGGSVTKVGTGKYNVRVGSVTDDCRITVNVDGKVAGASQFRVRTVPTPQAYVGGQASGASVAANILANQEGIAAGIKDFPFELKYTIAEYQVIGLNDEGDIIKASGNSAAFTAQARKIMQIAKPGDVIQINNLFCIGPDGVRRKLPALVYNIN
ncbi:MAG TPA: gliding motility protein GldM [Flavisolibacter sp.]|jgi:gliding motility-associated protein GldM|nr:gliding motility protein GldM [Flavisolibacter sp.]